MIFHEIGLHKPDFDENLHDHIYVTRRITACYSRGLHCSGGNENDKNIRNQRLFEDIGLHKPEFAENLYDHIYVTRRNTACYSRARNCDVRCENT